VHHFRTAVRGHHGRFHAIMIPECRSCKE
jgi:hypothetical protein